MDIGGGEKDDHIDTKSLVFDGGHNHRIESLVLDDGGHHHLHYNNDHLIKSVSEDGGHHHRQLIWHVRWILFLFGVIVVPYFILYHSAFPLQLVPRSYNSGRDSTPIASSSSSEKRILRLETILEKTAMVNKTVIITTINEAWATPNSIVDVFLESFRIGIQTKKLLNHLVIVALDQKAYDRCMALHPHCYNLNTSGID
ncbi:hypothetical protein U1Q18_032325, partial [Sarracenia purpurea var. burkii]